MFSNDLCRHMSDNVHGDGIVSPDQMVLPCAGPISPETDAGSLASPCAYGFPSLLSVLAAQQHQPCIAVFAPALQTQQAQLRLTLEVLRNVAGGFQLSELCQGLHSKTGICAGF